MFYDLHAFVILTCFVIFISEINYERVFAYLRKIVNKKHLRHSTIFFKISDVGKIALYIFYEKYNLKVVVLVGNYDRNTKITLLQHREKGGIQTLTIISIIFKSLRSE